MRLFGFLPKMRRETWAERRERLAKESAASARASAQERALFAAQPDAVKARYAFARKCMALCLPFFIIAGALGWKIAPAATAAALLTGLLLYRKLYSRHGADAVLPLITMVIGLGLGLLVVHPVLAPPIPSAESHMELEQPAADDISVPLE
jgi:hypothetical protein